MNYVLVEKKDIWLLLILLRVESITNNIVNINVFYVDFIQEGLCKRFL